MGITAVEAPPLALEYWYDVWKKQRAKSVSEARQAADETRWRKYVAPTFKDDRLVTRITRRQLEAWIDKIRDHAGIYTVEAAVMSLRQVLALAHEAGALRSNPAKMLLVGAPAGIEAIDTVLTSEQFEAIVEAAHPDYAALIRVGGETGALWREAIGLTVPSINFKDRSISIGHWEVNETGGVAEAFEYPIERARTLAMSPTLSATLADWILSTNDWRDELATDWVFLTPRDHVHPLRSNFNRFVWRPALEKAGLDPRAFTFHDLRHFAASQWLRNGVSLEEVSRRLGHKQLRTTVSMYGHLVPPEEDDA